MAESPRGPAARIPPELGANPIAPPSARVSGPIVEFYLPSRVRLDRSDIRSGIAVLGPAAAAVALRPRQGCELLPQLLPVYGFYWLFKVRAFRFSAEASPPNYPGRSKRAWNARAVGQGIAPSI